MDNRGGCFHSEELSDGTQVLECQIARGDDFGDMIIKRQGVIKMDTIICVLGSFLFAYQPNQMQYSVFKYFIEDDVIMTSQKKMLKAPTVHTFFSGSSDTGEQ